MPMLDSFPCAARHPAYSMGERPAFFPLRSAPPARSTTTIYIMSAERSQQAANALRLLQEMEAGEGEEGTWSSLC